MDSLLVDTTALRVRVCADSDTPRRRGGRFRVLVQTLHRRRSRSGQRWRVQGRSEETETAKRTPKVSAEEATVSSVTWALPSDIVL